MDLLVVPVPLFDHNMAVDAYYFRHQKGNDILDKTQGTAQFDGAMVSEPLQMLNMIGIEAFTMGKPIFVPINNYMLLTHLELQCAEPPEKIVFLVGETVNMDEPYIANMKRLRELGYRFGIQKITEMDPYTPVLEQCDYIFYDFRNMNTPDIQRLRINITRSYPKLRRVYTHIPDMDAYNEVKKDKDGLFEGRFYRTPLTRGRNEVTPLQVNQINLINLVRDENFEFDDVAKIIQRDTALTINLLRLVNSPYIGLRNKVKTIGHAVTMLGQDEVKKWITTAVAKLLGSEKPSEVSRLSLVRARFCEGLAALFGMEREAQGLFLMGLFSVLDAILEMPMDEALGMVHVSDVIRDALVNQSGDYYPVYDFLLQYEAANWKTVSRLLILNDLKAEDVYNVYVESLCWYRELIMDDGKDAK